MTITTLPERRRRTRQGSGRIRVTSARVPEGGAGLVRLAASAVLFLLVLLVKTVVPDMGYALLGHIESGPGSREVLETLGRAVTDGAMFADFWEDNVVRVFGLGQKDEGTPAAAEPELDGDPPAGYLDVPAGDAVTPTAPGDDVNTQAALPSQTPDGDQAAGDVPAAFVLGDGMPEIYVDEVPEDALSGEQVIDDTPAEPFVIPPPDIVLAEPVSIAFSYTTPVVGAVTSGFGYREHPLDGNTKFHYGVDIAAARGTEIAAFADGTVISVATGTINGKYFKVEHANGIVSMYAHCDKILVKKGQKVKRGQAIALVGSTGQSSGPHLHFQIYKDGRIIDPVPFLKGLY